MSGVRSRFAETRTPERLVGPVMGFRSVSSHSSDRCMAEQDLNCFVHASYLARLLHTSLHQM
jgi:hypothetical protein